MSVISVLILLVLGLAVIFLLLWVIFSQIKKDKIRSELIKNTQAQSQAARVKIIESIQVLLKVADTKELGWIEASIRIKALLDQLSVDLSEHDVIGVFYKVYVETEHIPTHDGWNALPKNAKTAFRKTFQECETKYEHELIAGKNALLAYALV